MKIPYLNTTLIAAAAFGLWNYGEHLNAPLAPLPKGIEVKAPPHLAETFLDAATAHRLDAVLLVRLVKQESGFRPGVCSDAGACGLAQLMPGTAKELGVKDRSNPAQSIHGGAKYLRKMLDKYGRVDLALAAYNCGPGCVDEWIAGKRVLPQETIDYVPAILGPSSRSEAENACGVSGIKEKLS